MENKPIKKPEIVVFAGPNSSGKSTITDLLRPPMLPYVNADEIQRVLDCDNMEAAKIAEKRREDYLDKHKGFCFETVLSTDRNLKLLKRERCRLFRPLLLCPDSRPANQSCPCGVPSFRRRSWCSDRKDNFPL